MAWVEKAWNSVTFEDTILFAYVKDFVRLRSIKLGNFLTGKLVKTGKIEFQVYR